VSSISSSAACLRLPGVPIKINMLRFTEMRPLPLTALVLLLPVAASARPTVPTAAVLSSDAALVAAQTHTTVRLWERATGKLRVTFDSSAFFRGAVTHGALALVTDAGPEVRLGPAFTERVKLQAPPAISRGPMTISADGSVAANIFTSGNNAGDHDRAALYDTRTGARLAVLRLRGKGARIMGVALGPAGRLAAVYGDRGRKRALMELYTQRKGRKKPRPPRRVLRWQSKKLPTTFSAAISPDGRHLALAAGDRILLWKLKRRRLLTSSSTARIKTLFPPILRGPGVRMPPAFQLAFSADSTRLASLHALGVVGVATWSVPALQPATWHARPQGGGDMRQVAFDETGKLQLITAGHGPTVTVSTVKNRRFAPSLVLSPTAP